MRLQRLTMLLCCITLFTSAAVAQAPANAQIAPAAAIRQVLTDQQAAWNRGDIDTFMRGYDNSSQTTFIGKTIAYGYQPILERYEKTYATRAAMGTLTFSDVTVKMLDRDYAVVTGFYHLVRTTNGGGNANGVYSLIFARKPKGWRIILDHSSST